MNHKLVLIVGAADTGRAPMAAALLERLIANRDYGWSVASAGIVGHDGDPAEPEARRAMLILGLDIEGHRARSLGDDLVDAAAALVAVEGGVARVVRARFPDRLAVSLGELAGRPRDIPDPSHMQLGAWLQYAAEIESLLKAGLPRLRTLLAGAPPPEPGLEPTPAPKPEPAGAAEPPRLAAVDRVARLLALAADLPGVVDWEAARAQLLADLARLAQPQTPDDLARPFVALLRERLAGARAAPNPALARTLAAAVAHLRTPIMPGDLEALAKSLE